MPADVAPQKDTDAPQQIAKLSVVFWGHACVGVHIDGEPTLLIDPFDPAGLGAVEGPPPIPVEYPWVIATHEHSDHAAFHTQPNAQVIAAPGQHGPLTLDYRVAAHDPLGGRLRGGTVRLLEVRALGKRIIHCSDLGERPDGPLLDWLSTPTADLLVIPAGGYFTLNADGAAELVARANPRAAFFCHTKDDGLPLNELDPQDLVEKRTAHWPQHHTNELRFDNDTHSAALTTSPQPLIVHLQRPDGLPLSPSQHPGENG